MRIVVVGYCAPTKFDENEARWMTIDAYAEIHTYYSYTKNIAIVSGLTNAGVLAIPYQNEVKRGWRTVGVACKRAIEHKFFPVDEQLVVGENWGDERMEFVSILDGIIRIGMGKQSIRETDEVRGRGFPNWEYDLPFLG